jgi:hypothetical protein
MNPIGEFIMKLSPQEAAALVRAHIGPHLDIVELHRIHYVNEICGHLRLEPTHMNHARVRHALEHCGVDTNYRQEYPKWVDVKDDEAEDGKRAVLVGSKAEHDALADRLEI